MDNYFIVSEIYHLFCWSIAKKYNSFKSLKFNLLRVNGGKHLLQSPSNHSHLSIFIEIVKNHQWILE